MPLSEPDHRAEARLDDFLGLVSDLDLVAALQQIVGIAAAWTGADQAVLEVLDGSGAPIAAHGITGDGVRRLLARVPDLEELGRALPTRIEVEGVPFADLVVVATTPDRFSDHDRYLLHGLARVASVAIRNARTFGLSERRRESVEATARVTESLHPPYSLVDPLDRVVEGAREIARGTLAAVVRASETGYDVPAAVNERAGALAALLDELRSEVKAAQTAGEPFELPYGEGGTVAGIPLNPELAFEGVVVVAVDHGGGALPAEDRALLDSFVTHGSLVLDRAALLQERQRDVVAADRDRIARDLHDVVIQRLFATGLKLQSSRRESESVAQDPRVQEVVRDLDLTIQDIRSTIFELEHGHEESLRAGVAALIREYEGVLGFLPTVRTWGPVNTLVDQHLARQALVVLREALSNCARHAGAAHCSVEVSVAEGWLLLEIVDDGRGPGDLTDGQARRSGLRNLEQRADALGGGLVIAAEQPHGTRLSWRVPAEGR